ncbi:MAG TPA: decaprenyl-phosphate phosphoribosyltransferase [Solirubrobacteraceae bacterium]|nr:decaprenyl-phosphate phosphoribosyltransferase [Solirubrobacteraceae bacterium]
MITPIRPRRSRPRALLALARPRQWVKNALVIAAPGAAGALGHDDVPVRVVLAAFAFCLISASIYALNDVRDRHEDQRHPRKRSRPVAAGEVAPRQAVIFGIVLMLAGLILAAGVRPLLALVALGYVALTVSYTWVWRRLPVLDLVALAGGFVLRAVAGGVAAPVGLSRWFVLVITFAAIFVAVGKRLAESIRTTTRGHRARAVMRHYSPRRLRLLLSLSGAGALFAYCVWAFALPTVNGIPWRPLTIIPFAVCLLRYGGVVRAGRGEAPEEVLMSDRVLAAGGVAWLVLFALGVNAAG